MIAHLRGIISKGNVGEATVDVGGVGYGVRMPNDAWDKLEEGALTTLWISTYVREDRFDLFGFTEHATRTLFERFIELQGIGPRMGLELCAVPKGILLQAIAENDPRLLTSIKGIGKKTAEKLLIELKNLAEKEPTMFDMRSATEGTMSAHFDQDAVAALTQLGYASSEVMRALELLPKDLATTEQRVTAALRSL